MVPVIIVTYNGSKWIQKCLTSISNSEEKCKVIIVDNASTDNTIDLVTKYFPEVEIIRNNSNEGFAKANNIGIREALKLKSNYIFLLNQDTWIKKDTITRLIEIINVDNNVGIVSPIHLNGTMTGLDEGFSNYLSPNNTPLIISDLYLGKRNLAYETSFVNAAAWLIKRECIEKVGGFNTKLFFHYGEDNEYCNRVLWHGFKIKIATMSEIAHDRDHRKGNRPKEFEKESSIVNRKVALSDLNMDDKLLLNEIKDLNKNFLKKQIKSLVLLRLSRFVSSLKENKKQIKFLEEVIECKERNRKGELCWISDL